MGKNQSPNQDSTFLKTCRMTNKSNPKHFQFTPQDNQSWKVFFLHIKNPALKILSSDKQSIHKDFPTCIYKNIPHFSHF